MKIDIKSTVTPLFLFILTTLLVSACTVQKSAITGDRRAYGYSWEQEVQIGKESDQQIQQQYGIYEDAELQAYVDEIGRKMLEVSHMRREDTPKKYRNTEFTFRVLDSPVINAFALPGGYVYVTRGLLAHLDNEAQLAVVLGHEIGHVAARHASQRAFEQKVGQIALIGGAVAGEELLGLSGQNILGLGSQAVQMLFLSYGRDDERESDHLGVEYASMQNYKAAEGAQFFVSLERMSEQSGQSLPSWQSTHPDPAKRADDIPKLAGKWEEKGYEQTIDNSEQYMDRIDNIIYGTNPREGFTRDGRFYHPGLEFQFPYPEGWQVINQRSMVAVTNSSQDAVSIMKLDSKSASAEASVNEFVNQEGITLLGRSGTSNNGLNAYRAEAAAQSDDGTPLKLYVYAVEHGNMIYRFVNYTTADKYEAYRDGFREITGGFGELNDPEVLNMQPVRLHAFKTDRSGTFSSFIPDDLDNLPVNVSPEDLAIINQVELDERIERGSWLKLPLQ